MTSTVTRKVEIVFVPGATVNDRIDAHTAVLTSLREHAIVEPAPGYAVKVTFGTEAEIPSLVARAQSAGQRYALLDLVVRPVRRAARKAGA